MYRLCANRETRGMAVWLPCYRTAILSSTRYSLLNIGRSIVTQLDAFTRSLTETGLWMNNGSHCIVWDVTIHPYRNFNGCLIKPPLKLVYGWVYHENTSVFYTITCPCRNIDAGLALRGAIAILSRTKYEVVASLLAKAAQISLESWSVTYSKVCNDVKSF